MKKNSYLESFRSRRQRLWGRVRLHLLVACTLCCNSTKTTGTLQDKGQQQPAGHCACYHQVVELAEGGPVCFSAWIGARGSRSTITCMKATVQSILRGTEKHPRSQERILYQRHLEGAWQHRTSMYVAIYICMAKPQRASCSDCPATGKLCYLKIPE